MRRLATSLALAVGALLVLAPLALASSDGQGTYGPVSDKVTTNTGFILIAFFPAFIALASLLQWWLDKRKHERSAAKKARATSADWRGGW